MNPRPVGKSDASTLPRAAVTVADSCYRVDLGEGSWPRIHRVDKDKRCSCAIPGCPAIAAVRRYLLAGGARAPGGGERPCCPVCGAGIRPAPEWDGRFTREPGWTCRRGGLLHFLQAKAARLQQALADHPYLIPPGRGCPGLRREDLMTYEECCAVNGRIRRRSGYDPAD